MKTSEILIAARKKIENEKNWTKRVYARDSEGEACAAQESEAKCFCSLGAILSTVHPIRFDSFTEYADAYDKAKSALSLSIPDKSRTRHIAVYNDTHTHAEVLELFDKAIASAIAEENQNGAE